MGGYHIQVSRSTVVGKAICSVLVIIKIFALRKEEIHGLDNLSPSVLCSFILRHIFSYIWVPFGSAIFEDTQF